MDITNEDNLTTINIGSDQSYNQQINRRYYYCYYFRLI